MRGKPWRTLCKALAGLRVQVFKSLSSLGAGGQNCSSLEADEWNSQAINIPWNRDIVEDCKSL